MDGSRAGFTLHPLPVTRYGNSNGRAGCDSFRRVNVRSCSLDAFAARVSFNQSHTEPDAAAMIGMGKTSATVAFVSDTSHFARQV